MIERNAEYGVTWIHSYATPDRKRTFCIYDAPTPEAIRRAAACNKLPVTQITEVRVLDPYFYLRVKRARSEPIVILIGDDDEQR